MKTEKEIRDKIEKIREQHIIKGVDQLGYAVLKLSENLLLWVLDEKEVEVDTIVTYN